MTTPHRTTISMRDLQKISAAEISALGRPVPIRSGGKTLGLLVPLRRPDVERLRALDAEGERLGSKLTEAQKAELMARIESLRPE
jgi:hypothetical protein